MRERPTQSTPGGIIAPPRRRRPRRSVMFSAGKRWVDIVGSALGLIVSAPLLALGVCWILLVDGRPVFYQQWRVGQDGWLFRIYKLRTMSVNAEPTGDAQFARPGDPRVIRGGALIRKAHLDELPQLWNILRGQMSLVGPRPERPEIHRELRRHIRGIDRRLATKPGLTGLAQVCNGYTNDLSGARRKLAFDLLYIRRLGFLEDLRLMFLTVPRLWDRMAL
ncbi:MAG: sugar transferase [Phycisphaeraceae bacterium]|nr:sugar transferase [Phycisphaeraceae bacterium]